MAIVYVDRLLSPFITLGAMLLYSAQCSLNCLGVLYLNFDLQHSSSLNLGIENATFM